MTLHTRPRYVAALPALTPSRADLHFSCAAPPQTKLFILSDPPIAKVFSDEKPKNNGEITAHQRAVMDDLGLSADVVGASSIFTGDEEVFAFARALVSC